MFNIECSYEQLSEAAQTGKKAVIRGNTITIDPERGIPIVYDVVPGNCIHLYPTFNVANIHVFRSTTRMRWMNGLNKWQDLTNLFANYGTEHIETISADISKYQPAIGRIVPVPDVNDQDFTIFYELQHHRLYIHCFVYVWNREVMRRLRDAVNQLQHDWPYDTYIYSLRPNEEYALSADTTFKFAKLAGYEFLETVVLGDGYEHDIYKRDKNNDTRFISKHV